MEGDKLVGWTEEGMSDGSLDVGDSEETVETGQG